MIFRQLYVGKEPSGRFTENFEPKESFFRIKVLKKSWGLDLPVNRTQITGLTEEGLSQEALTLPSAYEGAPGAAFTKEALVGASALVELRIPEGIASLPDQAFAGCPALERVILEHKKAPCGLGKHSLDGVRSLRFFVPKEAWTLYRDGYGCEENAWTPYLDQIFTY